MDGWMDGWMDGDERTLSLSLSAGRERPTAATPSDADAPRALPVLPPSMRVAKRLESSSLQAHSRCFLMRKRSAGGGERGLPLSLHALRVERRLVSRPCL